MYTYTHRHIHGYTHMHVYMHMCVRTKLFPQCPTLCDPIHSSPGPPVHGILQARTLDWVSTPSQPRDWTPISCTSCWQVGSLPQVPPERHIYVYKFIDQPLTTYTVILSRLGLCWLGFIFFNLIIYYIYICIYIHTHIYLYKHIYVCAKDFAVLCVTGETVSCSLSFKYFFS